MDFHELELFIHLTKTLNFSKTSREMHISPSALSRTIRRLEEEEGEILFLRDNRRVAVTGEGKRYLTFAKAVLEEYRKLKEERRPEHEHLRGVLRIYASVTASYTILSDILKQYRKTYPKIHIDLLTGSAAGAIEQIQENKADITIAAKPQKLPPSLSFLPLVKTPLHFISPSVDGSVKTKVHKDPVPWKDIPFILADRGESRKMINSWFHHNGIHPEIYASVSGNEAIIAMVALGFGIGIVPGLVIDQSPMKKDIEKISSAPRLDPYTVGLCTSNLMLQSPVVKSFWETAEISRSGSLSPKKTAKYQL